MDRAFLTASMMQMSLQAEFLGILGICFIPDIPKFLIILQET